MVIGQAVVATCVHCDRPVRPTVTLRGDFADLQTRLRHATVSLCRDYSAAGRLAYDLEIRAIVREFVSLQAELQGFHYTCQPTIQML